MKKNTELDDTALLGEISSKLTHLTAMIGLSQLSSTKKEDQIQYLVGFGLSISEISKLTGMPEGTVKPLRAKLSKSKKR